MKKAQLSMFLILAVFILVIMLFAFSLTGKLSEIFFSSEERVEAFATDCLEISQKCMLVRIAENGGYSSFNYGLNPLDTLKTELEKNIATTSEVCQNNFKDFQNLKVESKKPEVSTSFNSEDTSSEMSQEIIITKGEDVKTIRDFYAEIPVRFKKTYDFSSKLIEKPSLNISEDYINLELSKQDDFSVNVYETEENQIITITDEKSKVEKLTEYKFSFLR